MENLYSPPLRHVFVSLYEFELHSCVYHKKNQFIVDFSINMIWFTVSDWLGLIKNSWFNSVWLIVFMNIELERHLQDDILIGERIPIYISFFMRFSLFSGFSILIFWNVVHHHNSWLTSSASNNHISLSLSKHTKSKLTFGAVKQ